MTEVHGSKLRKFLIEKGRIRKEAFDFVNWRAIGVAHRKMSQSKRTWISKHVCRFAATGTNMARRKEWNNPRCPRCGYHGEDSNHVVVCPDTVARKMYHRAILEFQEKLENLQTHHLIISTMTLALFGGEQSFFCDMVKIDKSFNRDPVQRMIASATLEQDSIGWHNFVEGKISNKWAQAQELDYRSKQDCQRSGERWAVSVVNGLYGVIQKMWTQRNKHLHNKEREHTVSKKRERLEQLIDDEFDLGPLGLRECDRAFMNVDKKRVKRWHMNQQVQWLEGMVIVRKFSHKKLARKGRRKRKLLNNSTTDNISTSGRQSKLFEKTVRTWPP